MNLSIKKFHMLLMHMNLFSSMIIQTLSSTHICILVEHKLKNKHKIFTSTHFPLNTPLHMVGQVVSLTLSHTCLHTHIHTHPHSPPLLVFMFHITPVSCTAVSSTWSHNVQYDGMMCHKQAHRLFTYSVTCKYTQYLLCRHQFVH